MLKMIIFLLPLVFIAIFTFLKIYFPDLYVSTSREDSIVEHTQSILFILSSIIALSMAVTFFKKKLNLYGLLYALLALGLFFIFMEEIRWGESMLGFTVSDFFKSQNLQQETSLHNLTYARWYMYEFYILIGFFCAFSWLMVPKKIKDLNSDMVKYLVPDGFLILYFFPVFFIYLYIVYLSGILVRLTGINAFHIGYMTGPYFIDFIDQEPAEFLLATGLFLFVLINRYRLSVLTFINKNSGNRVVLKLLTGLIVISLPLHFIHVTMSERIYPYDILDLGNKMRNEGRSNEAIEQYQKALQIDPNHAELHNNLGVTLKRSGRFEEAVVHFLEAMRINPGDAVTLNNLANALTGMGKADEAVPYYTEALKLNPTYSTHANLGQALLILGRLDEAVEHLSRSLDINPGNAMAQNNIANALARKGKLQEAATHYKEAIRLNADFSEAHYNLGIVLKMIGKNEEAIQHFSEALRINPGYERARRNLKLLKR